MFRAECCNIYKIIDLSAFHLPKAVSIMRKKTNLKARFLTSLVVAAAVLFFSQCKKEDLQFDNDVPMAAKMDAGVKLAATGITSSSYYLENALPTGYVKDGSRDYTSYIQAAVNKYSNIVFPNFPILVNDDGINIGSNKTLTFQDGAEIRLKGTSSASYNILNIVNASNITLYNPVIKGDRNSHIGTSGEFGIGIGIRGANDITIYSPKVTECWGDGIYIGQGSNYSNSKNIVINDAYLRKNRRDGISIISVDGLQLNNLYAGYTDGTSPWCGINFEPNNSACELKNIRINNPRTEYNAGNGIQIGTSRMLTGTNKEVDIVINNHKDVGSNRYAFKLSQSSTGSGKLYGEIKVVNPTWHKFLDRPIWMYNNQPGLKTEISSPEVMIASGSILSWNDAYDLMMKNVRLGSISIIKELLSIVDEPNLSVDSSPTAVVFAVNAGGYSFTASNGINYQSDKNYSGGYVYKTSNGITNTEDDALYQSERFGNFKYEIPLANGTYDIVFRFAEIYHSSAGKRQFDVFGEATSLISNIDIYSEAGRFNGYDIIRTVTVSDGVLNLDFKTDVDNAKLSAFHIVKN